MAVTASAASAARRTAVAAARGALQTTHSAANLVNSVDKEAARMLRTAEGLARSALARLEFLGREVALKKKEEEKDEKKDTDATMAGTAAAPAAARPRRRGGRARKAAPPPVAADLALTAGSPLLADAARAAPPSRTLQQQCSRERSPRRELSPNATSTASVSLRGSGSDPGLGGFEVGQTVAFCGLTTRPELDGTLGTVMSVDVAAGRVAVKVSASGESIRVKPVNIKLTIFGAGGRQVV